MAEAQIDSRAYVSKIIDGLASFMALDNTKVTAPQTDTLVCTWKLQTGLFHVREIRYSKATAQQFMDMARNSDLMTCMTGPDLYAIYRTGGCAREVETIQFLIWQPIHIAPLLELVTYDENGRQKHTELMKSPDNSELQRRLIEKLSPQDSSSLIADICIGKELYCKYTTSRRKQ